MSEEVTCAKCNWIVEDWQYGNLCGECRLPELTKQFYTFVYWRNRYEILRQINEILGEPMTMTTKDFYLAYS